MLTIENHRYHEHFLSYGKISYIVNTLEINISKLCRESNLC